MAVVIHVEHGVANGIGHEALADVQGDVFVVGRVHHQGQVDDAVAIDALRGE